MRSNIKSLITGGGKNLGPIMGTTRHMTIEVTGTPGTITGSKSVTGVAYTEMDTYDFEGPVETFDIDVDAFGTFVHLSTTGTFTDAWIITEG